MELTWLAFGPRRASVVGWSISGRRLYSPFAQAPPRPVLRLESHSLRGRLSQSLLGPTLISSLASVQRIVRTPDFIPRRGGRPTKSRERLRRLRVAHLLPFLHTACGMPRPVRIGGFSQRGISSIYFACLCQLHGSRLPARWKYTPNAARMQTGTLFFNWGLLIAINRR